MAVYEREICFVELSGQIVTSRYFLNAYFKTNLKLLYILKANSYIIYSGKNNFKNV